MFLDADRNDEMVITVVYIPNRPNTAANLSDPINDWYVDIPSPYNNPRLYSSM